MEGVYRIAAATPRLHLGDAAANAKELVRLAKAAALRLVASESEEPLGDLLRQIASAPITPELLPGAAANDSEARLGPYELHDFFLFHYLVDGASADKLRELARIAFAGEHSREEVDGTLAKFIRRFHAAQYKRNCVPDGPKITLSLSPRADWRMPSDM